MNDRQLVKIITDRMKVAAGAKNQAQLARAIGIQPPSVSDAILKGKIPERWFEVMLEKYGVTKDELCKPPEGARAMIEHAYGHETEEEPETGPALDMVSMTIEILKSNTVYKTALASNIRAFHQAVKGEQEMDDLRGKVENMTTDNQMMRQRMARLEERLLALEGVEPEKKRAGNDH